MKTQSKKLKLAAIALMALVTIALLLVGCKNDTTSFTEPVEYTVTFNTNGSTEVESQTVQSGGTLSIPADTPSREGYEFLGWYSEFDFTNPYDFNSPVTSNFILYANWKVEITPEEDDVIDKLTGDGLYTLVATGDWMNPQAIWTNLIAAGITAKINLDLRDVTALTNIGNQAFSAWENLTDIKLPDSVTSIGEYAFSGCSSLTGISLPESVTTINDEAFGRCNSLTTITIPSGVENLSNRIFFDCRNLKSITLHENLESIGGSAFSGCISLKSINLPNSLTSIGRFAFGNCSSLTEISIPNNVTSIGELAFYRCENLKKISVPDKVTSIGDETFLECYKLETINLPDSVESIGKKAFCFCRKLVTLKIEAENPPQLGENVFEEVTSDFRIQVPNNSVTSYKAADGWNVYAEKIVEY